MTFMNGLGLSRACYGPMDTSHDRYNIAGLQRMNIILRTILVKDALKSLWYFFWNIELQGKL